MELHHRLFALAALGLTVALAVAVLAVDGGSLARLFAQHPSPPAGPTRTKPITLPLASSRPQTPARATPRPVGPTSPLSADTAARLAAVDSIVCAVGLTALAALLVKARLDAREARDYALFEIHLSMHDDAEPRDLRDMVEALAAAVREWPVQRARHGQPFFAIELHHGGGPDGGQFLIALRCERDLAVTLESIVAGAYPDVRIGQIDGAPPAPIRARLREPGYVLRLRKERSFIYPLAPDDQDGGGSPLIEAIAQTQVTAGVPSSVRMQFTPAPLSMEAWARRRFRAHERRLAHADTRAALSPGRLQSVLDQEELRSARRARDSTLLWFEIQVAAPTGEHANRVAAALIARRGENRLQRRRMTVRQQLYRRRFADAYPPLLPTFGFGGFHSLASASEIAHLLTLPTARMKAVPVRRLTVPRLPPPPEIVRAEDLPVRMPPPPDGELADTRELPAAG